MPSGLGRPAEQVLVITPSALLRKRMEAPLNRAGYAVQTMSTVREFLGSRRQRPFLGCFLDLRNQDEGAVLGECVKSRPSERYIVIRDAGQRSNGAANGEVASHVFGFLREHFAPEELVTWCRRAATEAKLQQGDQSLDDFLYERFRSFLQNLGPSSMTSLHDLVTERVERSLITSVLEWAGGNQSKAAKVLGVHRNTLRTKIRTLGIDAR